MSRDERLHIMMNVLRSKGCFKRDDMLAKLEISHPTFKRDLEYLRSRYQAEIEYDPADNLYRLVTADTQVGRSKRGKALELAGLWFSKEELHALLSMYVLLDEYGAKAILGPHLSPFKERIEKLLGEGAEIENELRKRVRILPMASRRLTEFLPELTKATLLRKRVQLTYISRSKNEETQRVVSPQRIVHYRDNWYLDAYCHLRDRLTTFSIDAIRIVITTKQSAVEIDEDELEKILASSYGIFSGVPTAKAVLLFSSERSRWVCNEVWHPNQAGRWIGDQWQLEFPISDTRELAMDIMRHGHHVKVLAPKPLAQMIRELHLKAANAAD